MKKIFSVVGLCIVTSSCCITMNHSIKDDAMDLDEDIIVAPVSKVKSLRELSLDRIIELGDDQDIVEFYQGLVANGYQEAHIDQIISHYIKHKPHQKEMIAQLVRFVISLVEDELREKNSDNIDYLLEQEPLKEKSFRMHTAFRILTLLLNAAYFQDKARTQPLTVLFLNTFSKQNKSAQRAIARYFMSKLSSKDSVHSICQLVAENEDAALQCLEIAPVLGERDRRWVVEWAILFGRSLVLVFLKHTMSRTALFIANQTYKDTRNFLKRLIYRGLTDELRQCLEKDAYEVLLVQPPLRDDGRSSAHSSVLGRKGIKSWFEFFAYAGYTECIRHVLHEEPCLKLPAEHAIRALGSAIGKGRDAIVELLADMPNPRIRRALFMDGISYVMTYGAPKACRNGHLSALKLVLSNVHPGPLFHNIGQLIVGAIAGDQIEILDYLFRTVPENCRNVDWRSENFGNLKNAGAAIIERLADFYGLKDEPLKNLRLFETIFLHYVYVKQGLATVDSVSRVTLESVLSQAALHGEEPEELFSTLQQLERQGIQSIDNEHLLYFFCSFLTAFAAKNVATKQIVVNGFVKWINEEAVQEQSLLAKIIGQLPLNNGMLTVLKAIFLGVTVESPLLAILARKIVAMEYEERVPAYRSLLALLDQRLALAVHNRNLFRAAQIARKRALIDLVPTDDMRRIIRDSSGLPITASFEIDISQFSRIEAWKKLAALENSATYSDELQSLLARNATVCEQVENLFINEIVMADTIPDPVLAYCIFDSIPLQRDASLLKKLRERRPAMVEHRARVCSSLFNTLAKPLPEGVMDLLIDTISFCIQHNWVNEVSRLLKWKEELEPHWFLIPGILQACATTHDDMIARLVIAMPNKEMICTLLVQMMRASIVPGGAKVLDTVLGRYNQIKPVSNTIILEIWREALTKKAQDIVEYLLLNCLDLLMAQMEEPDLVGALRLFTDIGAACSVALLDAAFEKGYFTVIQHLLYESLPCVRAVQANKRPYLLRAVQADATLDDIRYLVSLGALDIPDSEGMTAFSFAMNHNRQDIAHLLDRTPLEPAAKFPKLEE